MSLRQSKTWPMSHASISYNVFRTVHFIREKTCAKNTTCCMYCSVAVAIGPPAWVLWHSSFCCENSGARMPKQRVGARSQLLPCFPATQNDCRVCNVHCFMPRKQPTIPKTGLKAPQSSTPRQACDQRVGLRSTGPSLAGFRV